MKLNDLIIIILFISVATGCKSIRVTDLRPQSPNNNLLPSLEPQIDIGSFQTAYSLGSTKSSGVAGGYGKSALGGVIGSAAYFGQSTSLADKRIQDAIIIFEREIRENISKGMDKTVGYAICKITTGETKRGGWGWLVFSFFNLTLFNWFGMPFFNYKTELELEVEIRDCNNLVVGRYLGYGFKKTPVAVWHGYSGGMGHVTGNESAARKSNIDAIKIAMTEIKNKIQNDSDRLNNKLIICI